MDVIEGFYSFARNKESIITVKKINFLGGDKTIYKLSYDISNQPVEFRIQQIRSFTASAHNKKESIKVLFDLSNNARGEFRLKNGLLSLFKKKKFSIDYVNGCKWFNDVDFQLINDLFSVSKGAIKLITKSDQSILIFTFSYNSCFILDIIEAICININFVVNSDSVTNSL
ncbi:hypothetical protein U6A24_11245 [Aquimarina gracilis]|uniref:Tubby C 2 n=1 Tax=Aquimarina gracilis TaxID=874422 RepID=A0ABU5ZW18_9FLAO|nr:hypothetical protein [Aquimarina gracilis]MEB3346041.1 hypothetical protein [Aquimarina gracilis]